MGTYNSLVTSLDQTLENFILEIKKHALDNQVTEAWTVKDVLCHITFWHNYYAKQYEALVKGEKPFIVTSRGGSTRNQDGVDSLKSESRENLIASITKSQESLRKSILTHQIPEMDYTDRRRYTTVEFLEVVTSHVKRHTKQVRKSAL